MAKPRNQFEVLAREAAERLDRHRELGDQLTLLPDEREDEDDQGAQIGRPAGARNKASSQLRRWLQVQGFRAPEEVLVEMAGMATSEDAFLAAMSRTEQLLAWAFDVDPDTPLPKGSARHATPAKRLELFMQLYTIQLRAAEAILPYTAPKVTPEGGHQAPVTIVMPGASVQEDRMPRDVTPRPGRSDARMRPPPLPNEMQRNQGFADAEIASSDDEDRTG